MSKMSIYEPAMCCPTGLCGVGIDQELLRISTVIDSLKSKGIEVERYNLSSNPEAFIKNKVVNDILMKEGQKALPIILVDDKVVIKGRYPSNDEISMYLNVRLDINKRKPQSKGCCCGGNDGCC